MKPYLLFACTLLLGGSMAAQKNTMMVRMAVLQIDSAHLEEYKAILKEEARASVQLEPGVIAIYPMYQQDAPTQVRILEIYASREAYEAHLKSPHFLVYKNSTRHMVRSLQLTDMEAIDPDTMPALFRKLKGQTGSEAEQGGN